MASIGDNIKHFRKAKNISQMELAAMTGINVKSLSFYENGKRHIPADYLLPLAVALCVSIDELCGVVKKQTVEDELARKIGSAILDVLREYDIKQRKAL